MTCLTVRGLENHKSLALGFSEGSVIAAHGVGELIGRILREEFWCRLEGRAGFVHCGWDFYMYIGVPRHCPEAEVFANELGLYVEEFASPYKEMP